MKKQCTQGKQRPPCASEEDQEPRIRHAECTKYDKQQPRTRPNRSVRKHGGESEERQSGSHALGFADVQVVGNVLSCKHKPGPRQGTAENLGMKKVEKPPFFEVLAL
jgi:hypothetical protein